MLGREGNGNCGATRKERKGNPMDCINGPPLTLLAGIILFLDLLWWMRD